MSRIVEAIQRMEAAGYRLEVEGGTLRVSPASRLNEEQRRWISQHKPALVRHVKALALPDVLRLVEQFDAVVMKFEEHGVCVPDADTTPPVSTRGEPC